MILNKDNTLGISVLPSERLDFINENLSLIQKKNGLMFGTDSYLLSAFVRANPSSDAADLGSGTGVAALLCASHNKFKKIYAYEIQPQYAELIGRNAKLNSFENTVIPICTDIRNSSAYPAGEISVVMSNPPYMPAGSGFTSSDSEMDTARRELNGTIGDFCSAASRMLRFGGMFYVVYRADRLADLIVSLRESKLEPKRMIFVYPDVSSKPSLVLIESKKGAAPSITVSPPLIVFNSAEKDGKRSYTAEMDRVYSEFSLDFLFDRRN